MLLCTLSDDYLGHSVNHTNRVAWVKTTESGQFGKIPVAI